MILRSLITLFACLVLISCDTPEPVDNQEPLVRPAKIMTVTSLAQSQVRQFPAIVEANQGANLAFRVSGEIEEFLVKPGDVVQQGQLLARLDDQEFQLRLNDRQARFELAKSQFERAKTLKERSLAAQSQLDEAQANLLITKAELERAQSDLEHTELRAPYQGTVARVFVKNRENIQAKQNILRILNRDLMDVSIQVPERIMAMVKRDANYQPTVTFDALPEQPFLISIKEWDTQADPVTLTYKVVFSLPSPETINVLPGMSATVYIDLSQVTHMGLSGIVLPVEAVFVPDEKETEQGQAYIWKYLEETQSVTLQKVAIGQVHSQGVVIKQGVSEGDQIIVAGVHHLKEGMKVKPWTKERGL